MIKKTKYRRSVLEINSTTEGETIETKMEKILNKDSIENIEAEKPLEYTRAEYGVVAETDIRSDRFDMAIDATDKVTKAELTRRNEIWEERKTKTEEMQKKQKQKNDDSKGGQTVDAPVKTTE